MKLSDRIDGYWRRHPRLFLAAVLSLALVVVLVLALSGSSGSRIVYQAF